MKIARKQKPGVGKDKKKKKKESYWNNFNRKPATATQPVILLPSHPNRVLRCLHTLFGINELPRSNATLEEEAIRPCSISPVQGERLWSCSYTVVTLTDMHSSDTVGYRWTKRYPVLGDVTPRINASLQHSEQGSLRIQQREHCGEVSRFLQ